MTTKNDKSLVIVRSAVITNPPTESNQKALEILFIPEANGLAGVTVLFDTELISQERLFAALARVTLEDFHGTFSEFYPYYEKVWATHIVFQYPAGNPHSLVKAFQKKLLELYAQKPEVPGTEHIGFVRLDPVNEQDFGYGEEVFEKIRKQFGMSMDEGPRCTITRSLERTTELFPIEDTFRVYVTDVFPPENLRFNPAQCVQVIKHKLYIDRLKNGDLWITCMR